MFFTAIVMPVAIGVAMAHRLDSAFSPWLFIITLSAALLYHAGLNTLNDYCDAASGADAANADPLTPFAGGSRMIQKSLMSMKETLALSLTLLALGTLAGLYLAYSSGPALLLIGAVGLTLGVAYSSPPLSLSSRGLGELAVALEFGILSVLGSYYAQTGRIAHLPELATASLPVSFLIAAILYINEFADYDADYSAGKRNLVVRLGRKRARIGFILLVALAYSSMVIGAMSGVLPLLTLIALAPGVFAAASAHDLYKRYDSKLALARPIKFLILAHLTTGALLATAFFLS